MSPDTKKIKLKPKEVINWLLLISQIAIKVQTKQPNFITSTIHSKNKTVLIILDLLQMLSILNNIKQLKRISHVILGRIPKINMI